MLGGGTLVSRMVFEVAHRMGRRGEHGLRPTIIKFLSWFDKEEFFKKRRVWRNLKATLPQIWIVQFEFVSDNSIHVNESPTSSKRSVEAGVFEYIVLYDWLLSDEQVDYFAVNIAERRYRAKTVRIWSLVNDFSESLFLDSA